MHCTIRTLISQMLRYKKELLLSNLIALLATIMTVAVPLFIPLLVDELLLHKPHGLSLWIRSHIYPFDLKGIVFFVLLLTLLLRSGSVLLSVLQSKLFTIISKNITYALREKLLAHLQKVSLKSYETMQSGEIVSKAVTDVETVDNFISVTVSKLLLSLFILLFSAVVLLKIHWQLGLFILLTNPIVVYFTAKMARRIGVLKREENRAVEAFQSSLSEIVELMPQIRAANKERHFFSKARRKAFLLKLRAIAFGYRSEAAQKLSYLIFLGGYELFRAVSILAVAYSDLSVGLMLAIFSYLWVMVTPTQDIIGFQYALVNAKAACARIEALFALPTEPQNDTRCNPFEEKASIAIRTENLGFSYDGKRRILQDISLQIEAGAKVAIVGPSGSGKTTLAQLLVGFYPVEEGHIYYDRCRDDEIALEKIREGVHLILQHPKLFNATMRFNLTLGKPYSDEAIAEAIRIAQLEAVVAQLPEGLDTQVGRDGVKLSGGQRQRVAIARMLLANPKVVILDESTSALDVHTEAKLFAALSERLAQKTVITIAHRLSTIENAEYVFVLEEGRLSDEGSPQTLLAKDAGYFSRMI